MMYTYGLSIGGLFVYKWITKGDDYYAAGDVISVFFGIVFGIFSLGMASPHFKALNDGWASLAEVLKVINRKPTIPIDDKDAIEFKPEDEGNITFVNVKFKYESWSELALNGVFLEIQK